jgi:1L-myo-inositol 1-phosphate cytidylyltransferase / CDP-L-myo-inositol myo-inositolphosphotransferase
MKPVSSPLPDSAPLSNIAGSARAAPTIVLVGAPVAWPRASGGGAADERDLKILGLGLARRMVLAAGHTGYRRVFYLAPRHTTLPGIATIADWSGLDAVLRAGEPGQLLIAPVTILGETGWLERLAETRIDAAPWAAAPGRVIVIPTMLVAEALAALGAEGATHSLTAVHDRLTQRFGPPTALPDGVDPLVVAAPTDIRVAERRLLRVLVKDTDGFMARHVERPISLAISRLLAATAVTPNQMTLVSVVVGLAGAPFFLSSLAPCQTAGALLLLAHSILDGCDGELARLKFQESRLGGILDFWGDNVVHSVIFACMAAGWSRAIGEAWPLLLGVSAVLGTLGSAGLVYWRVMRPKANAGPLYTSVSTASDRPLTRLLDALSRRDFIYLIIAFALFGEASWFVLLTALGAPTFFFLLVFLAARE